MNLQKTLVLSLLSFIASGSVCQAQLSNQEVIYKIHDISPVKEDNKVVSCDFSITFFNRSPEMVSNLSLNFSWLDEVVDNQIKAEKQEKVFDANGRIAGYNGKSKTEQFTAKKISVDVAVPPLGSAKQISIKSNIKTDRCFLLMQKPKLMVQNCRYGSTQSEGTAGICKGMFRYISPEQGDYYNEFKPISYDQEKQEQEDLAKKEKQELDNIYENALNSVKRISETLKTMQ